MPTPPPRLLVSPQRTALVMLAGVVCLFLLSIYGDWVFHRTGDPIVHFIRVFFKLDREGNISTWLSSFALMFSAVLLFVIGRARRQQKQPFAWHWLVLGAIFAYISVDELSNIHENLNPPITRLLGLEAARWWAWTIPLVACVAILGISYLRFLRHLPGRIALLFILSGVMYVGGAAGMEVVSLLYAQDGTRFDFTYDVLTATEETLELLGVTLFIYTLLTYLREFIGEVRITFSSERTEAWESADRVATPGPSAEPRTLTHRPEVSMTTTTGEPL